MQADLNLQLQQSYNKLLKLVSLLPEQRRMGYWFSKDAVLTSTQLQQSYNMTETISLFPTSPKKGGWILEIYSMLSATIVSYLEKV